MAKVALLTIHGMGETDRNYHEGLERALAARLGTRWAGVTLRPVYYQDILQDNQRAVWDNTRLLADVHYEQLRKFLLFGFSDAAGLEGSRHLPDSVYVRAQVAIARQLLIARDVLGGDGPVVVVSQSLGCQVFSSYLYDAQKARAGLPAVGIWHGIDAHAASIKGGALTSEEKAFLRGDRVQRWVTTGCNIPVFVAAYPAMDIRPIAPPPADGDFRWLNLYDPDDVLGWPLQPLSDGYRALVEDRAINAGRGALAWILKSWNPLSHEAYWTDGDVLDPLEAMLRTYL